LWGKFLIHTIDLQIFKKNKVKEQILTIQLLIIMNNIHSIEDQQHFNNSTITVWQSIHAFELQVTKVYSILSDTVAC